MKRIKPILIIIGFALLGWAICGAIIGIGRPTIGVQATLIVHAIAVPLVFGGLSWIYFRNFNYTSPLHTAIIFTGLVIFLDAFIVAPFAERSYAMFTSILGTWIPFALIFLSTYLIGLSSVSSSQVAQTG
jgi:multisubunit Na+/H+ antiporter MnhC subunit